MLSVSTTVHQHLAEMVVNAFPQQQDTHVIVKQATQEAIANKTLTNAHQLRASTMVSAYNLHQDLTYVAVEAFTPV